MPRPPDESPGNDAGVALSAAASDGRESGGGRGLGRRARTIGTLLWASFLAASVGTMFFFAFIAPEELLGVGTDTSRIDRMGVYTLGFFGLWVLSALASALTLYVHGQLDHIQGPKS
jgi:polyferredoxin